MDVEPLGQYAVDMQYSIVNYQSVINSSHSMRLDAAFFRPDYLKVQSQLEQISSLKLIDFGVQITQPTSIKRNYVDKGILFLRAQNVRPLSIELATNPVYISEEDAERLRENRINHKDILITGSGENAGQCAVYLENRDVISSCHTFIVKSGNLNPFFLAVFLNTKHGKALVERGKSGSAQPGIAPYFLSQIPMPAWDTLPSAIEQTYLCSKDLTELSKAQYIEAQAVLLAELALADWHPKQQYTFVKNFSDTQHTERIDAGYFHPKYDDIVNAIKSYSGGWNTLENLVILKKCVEVGREKYRDTGIPFVRVSNVSPFEITEEKYISEELYTQIEAYQPKQGEILLSKDASPGIAHFLRAAPKKMIPAGGILRLESKTDKFDNECLALVLNSILIQEQANRDVGGSVIPHWSLYQVAKTVIPMLCEEKQTEIKEKVAQSFNSFTRAKHLLECAKSAVETAIEQDEDAAISWLEFVVDIPLK